VTDYRQGTGRNRGRPDPSFARGLATKGDIWGRRKQIACAGTTERRQSEVPEGPIEETGTQGEGKSVRRLLILSAGEWVVNPGMKEIGRDLGSEQTGMGTSDVSEPGLIVRGKEGGTRSDEKRN